MESLSNSPFQVISAPWASTLEFLSVPNPVESGMPLSSAALNIVSLVLKNTALFRHSLETARKMHVPNYQTHFRTNLSLLAGGIALDALHTGLYLGQTALEKSALLASSVALDVLRLGTIGWQHYFPITCAALQFPEALVQMIYQTEVNYHYFNDRPSTDGNLYQAIQSNDPKLVDAWSKSAPFSLDKMDTGGPAGSVSALFIAAGVPDVKLEVFQALVRNGADPESRLEDPRIGAESFSLLEYLKQTHPDRADLQTFLRYAIENKKREAWASENRDKSSLEFCLKEGSSSCPSARA